MRNLASVQTAHYALWRKSFRVALLVVFSLGTTFHVADLAWGQQWHLRFPQGIPTNDATGTTAALPVATQNGAPGQVPFPPNNSASVPPSLPSTGTPAPGYGTTAPYGGSPGSVTAPGYNPNGIPTMPPGQTPPYSPGASFQGGITPPSTWDPFATPGQTAPTLFPYSQPGAPPGPYTGTAAFASMQRFMDRLALDYVWMPGSSADEFGINAFDLNATFAIPFMRSIEAPLLVTPGFGLQLWNGPADKSFDMPPRAWDAYLDTAWAPHTGSVVGFDLGFRVGVYSDFNSPNSDSLRYTGRGLITLGYSPRMDFVGGIYYLDRAHIKLLPVFGAVWNPDKDTRLRLVFPDPKLSWRLSTVGNTEWWWYLRGEYGGGSWTIKQTTGVHQTDYNDMRVGVGAEWDNPTMIDGLFEVGIAFNREIYFQNATQFEPNSTVYLRGSITY